MNVNNLGQSSLTAIAATTVLAASVAVIAIAFLSHFNASPLHLLVFSVLAVIAISVMVALNINIRRKWLKNLDRDTNLLGELTQLGVGAPFNPKIVRTEELKPLLRAINQQRRQMWDWGMSDPLTGVGNRRALDHWLKTLFTDRRTRAPVALLILDIDHFKPINDRFGHHVGDRMIKEFAAALRSRIRRGDLVARLGGDEFCVVSPATYLKTAVTLAHRIRATMPKYIALESGPQQVITWTGGLSASDPFDKTSDQVLWRADRALISAKESSRGQTVSYAATQSEPRPVPIPETAKAAAS